MLIDLFIKTPNFTKQLHYLKNNF